MPLGSYLIAVLILAGIVLVHEVGHYLAARRLGIVVLEFSIGFGPRLCSFYAFQTQWALRAIPLGGYCRFSEGGPDAWELAPPSARAKVLAAGSLANFTLFVLLLPVLALAYGVPWRLVPLAAAQLAQFELGAWFQGLTRLLQVGISQMQGAILLTNETAKAAVKGTPDLLLYITSLSLNLGFLNLLPWPTLDGGRLLMLGLEWARKRRLRPEVEAWVHAGSAIALLAFVAVLAVRDVLMLVKGAA